VPLYHPDCRAWEVTRDGRHVAVFIGDYFARGSKRSGAWCSAMRSQAKFPQTQAPIVINVCNFAKGDPALLSYDDARTLFHEFGHALHQMLSDVTYESISGTSVARDFVELPSQLYEHWLEVPEVLTEFATHAETGEPMPDAMLDRVIGASTFDMGFQTVEYVASALVDLAFHEGPRPTDPMARQAEVLEELGMPRPSECATRRRISPMSLPATDIPRAITATCGPRSWMPMPLPPSRRRAMRSMPTGPRALEAHILSTGGRWRRRRSTPPSGAGCPASRHC
jgi:Zn-dependent oligopeptidase